jgi:hypothetical protein
MGEFRLLSTSGLLGYSFPEASLEAGLARNPDMIGVDGGSTDPGPHYLGSGKTVNSRRAMKRDMQLMLRAGVRRGIPVVIGSCGGAGGEPHLQTCVEIAREIAKEDGLKFKLAVVHAEQDKKWVKRRLKDGKVRALTNVPELDEATVDRASRIVGMMGPEPIMKALDGGAQVVLAGRSSDPAPWAATIMRSQLPPAPAWYAGKMLECGATPATPKGHDCLFATVRDDHVVVEPTNPIRRCTPLSVANHALHENASPVIHHEPGGILDATNCQFEAESDRAVRVTGMEWRPQPYSIKLEGAEFCGYRAVSFCGTHDPDLIGQIDSFVETVHEQVAEKSLAFGVPPDQYKLFVRIYGRNAIMGAWEPERGTQAHELGILLEVIADDREVANAVLAIARVTTLHTDFPGRLCRSGNMAFPFSPSDIDVGEAYRFSVFHVVTPDDPLQMFPIEYEMVGK